MNKHEFSSINCITLLHYQTFKWILVVLCFMSWRVESRIQINTQFQHFNLTWILDSNIMTQLEYLISKFWLESSFDELKTRLNLNDSTQRNQSISSLYSLLNSSSFLSCWCQTNASNAISDLTTAEYTCLAFVKITSHVKTSSWLSVNILMTWFVSICWRCTSHCSFMFSCISRTHTSDFDLITELFIYILVIMLNLFDFLVKYVNSYFSDANVASWVQANFMQTSCALLSILQISSVNLL